MTLTMRATQKYADMESTSFRAVFTGEEVINMLDTDGEDGGMADIFFPGSDEEFGMQEEELIFTTETNFIITNIVVLTLS